FVSVCFFIFFFQAEDGIRDRNVTGVQTCALPICCLAMLTSQSTNQLLLLSELQIGFGILHIFFGKDGCKFLLKIASIQAGERWRSEERRVGKESRVRVWAAR